VEGKGNSLLNPGRYCGAIAVLLALALAFLANYAGNRSLISVQFAQYGSSDGNAMQVFHSRQGDYSEERSRWLSVARVPQQAEITLDSAHAGMLRFDPPLDQELVICGLKAEGQPVQYEVIEAVETGFQVEDGCLRLQPLELSSDPRISVRLVGPPMKVLEQQGVWSVVQLGSILLSAVCGLLVVGMAVRWCLVRRKQGGYEALVDWVDAAAPRLALAWVLLMGGTYALLTPPGAVADEEAHLAKVARIQAGVFVGPGEGERFADIAGMYGPFSGYPSNPAPFNGEQLRQQLGAAMECRPHTANLAVGANGYFPHQYLLPSLAFAANCRANGPFGVFLYGARLLNLMLAAGLVYLGVCWARRGRWALFAVATLPMSLFQMASLSADSLWLGASIAWLGLVSGLASGTMSPRRALPWLLGLAFCIAFLKPVAAWVLGAFLFVRPAYATWRSHAGTALLVVGLPWLAHSLGVLSVKGLAMPRPGVDVAGNLQMLVADPIAVARLMAATFAPGRLEVLLQQAIGVLGWLDVPLAKWSYFAAGCGLLASLFSNRAADVASTGWLTRLCCLLMSVGALAMIAMPLFIHWTAADALFVQGLQGRYFLVVLAFLLSWLGFASGNKTRLIAIGVTLLATLVAGADGALCLYDAYYVSGR
jgi:hypothetical protein